MTERIGDILDPTIRADEALAKRVAEWQALPIEQKVAPFLDKLDEQPLSELTARENRLHALYREAVEDRDRERASVIGAAGKAIILRIQQLKNAAAFSSSCPIAWLHSVDESEALKKVNAQTLKKLLADPLVLNRSLLVCGPTSAGKSTSMGIMVRRTIEAGYIQDRERARCSRPHIQWSYARALAQAARNHPLGQGECEAIANARSAGILVLDDLGLERDHAEIVDVVHERYEQGRVTWTTTGLNKDELNARYGEAFVRRLVEGRSQPGLIVNCFPKATA